MSALQQILKFFNDRIIAGKTHIYTHHLIDLTSKDCQKNVNQNQLFNYVNVKVGKFNLTQMIDHKSHQSPLLIT